jgi:hypothetical protein
MPQAWLAIGRGFELTPDHAATVMTFPAAGAAKLSRILVADNELIDYTQAIGFSLVAFGNL